MPSAQSPRPVPISTPLAPRREFEWAQPDSRDSPHGRKGVEGSKTALPLRQRFHLLTPRKGGRPPFSFADTGQPGLYPRLQGVP